MDIPLPKANELTIYSKSGCINCNNVKNLLKDKQMRFTIINCDDFLFDDKEYFLNFIKVNTGMEWNVFPMVFHGKRFIGGFSNTIIYLNKILDFESEF